MYQFYMIAWWSYILLLDGVLAVKSGRHVVLNGRLLCLVVISAAFWCLFELINLRLQNWFYINVPYQRAIRYTGYLLSYGTVIPAILLTKEAISRLLPDVRTVLRPMAALRKWAIPLGVLCLLLALAFPRYCFGLAWVFLIFVVDGYNLRKGYASFIALIGQGSLKEVLASALAGLACGVLWEFWNYWAVTKWMYTVPFFEDMKLFEMPAPGYLGFALFGVETVAFVHLLDGSRLLERWRWGATLAALAISVLSFVMIDRYTVFSYTVPVGRVSLLSEPCRQAQIARGVRTGGAIDPRTLTGPERDSLALMRLDGLGLRRTEALQAHGIRTIDGLARLSQGRLAEIIGEENMRRVRLYLNAARSYARAHGAASGTD